MILAGHPPGGDTDARACTITPVKSETVDFYELVERALEGLPPELAELLDNVAIVVDDWPDPSSQSLADGQDDALYGLYEGVLGLRHSEDRPSSPSMADAFGLPLR